MRWLDLNDLPLKMNFELNYPISLQCSSVNMKKLNPSSVALPFAHFGLTGLPLQSLRVFFMTNRKRLEKIYGNLYKGIVGFYISVCIYCGYPASTFDHCPPLCSIESIDINKFKQDGGKLLLYPCCTQFNNYLGTFSDENIFYRFGYLSFKYERRIKNLQYWSDEELSTMGMRMRQYIAGRQYKYEMFNNKLVRIHENMYNEEYMKI